MSDRRDAKPRQKTAPPAFKPGREHQRARIRLRAMRNRELGQTTGQVLMADHRPSGKTSGVVVGRGLGFGRMIENPATSFAWSLRRRLHPIRIAPTTVTDVSGKAIATITVDPVTGKRTRTALP